MSQPADPDAPNSHDGPEAQHAYDANIEVLPNGAVRAQLVELIGCYAIADDVTAALMAVAERIPAYYEWLRAHDDYTPVIHGPFRAAAKEIQRVTGNTADLDNVFFATDAEAVSAEDLDWLLALLDWSLDDLLRLGERIDPAARDTPTRVGPPANALLRQAAQTQARYLVLLNAAPDPTTVTLRDAPPLDQLREVREVSLQRLRNVSDADRERVFEVLGERWSLRKLLRCGILSARLLAEPLAATVAK